MLQDGGLERARADRYAGWDTAEAKAMLAGTLDAAAQRVLDRNLNPQPRSGRQERLENLVNRFI
jgi:xylose isomerase